MQRAREITSFGESDVVGGGFRLPSSPSNAGYNRHIANQPPQQRSHENLDPRLLAQLAQQRLANRPHAYVQVAPMQQAAQVPGHVVTSVYPTSTPPPPPPSSLPPQQGQAPIEASASTASDSGMEAPDSPLRGVVLRSAVASSSPPTMTTATAAAGAAGTLAVAEAWLAANSDPNGAPGDGPSAGSPSTTAGSSYDITLLPRRQNLYAEAVGTAPPVDEEAAPLPPTPTAAAGAAAVSGGGAGPQFPGSAAAPPPNMLRVASSQHRVGDSLQGPLPGGSSPKPRPGGPQPPLNPGPGGAVPGALFSSATDLSRAHSPAVYGSVVRRPATAGAAVSPPSPDAAMHDPYVVRDAGRTPGQAYGYRAAAPAVAATGTSSATAAVAASGGGEGKSAEILTIHPSHWESMSQLESDPSYLHYPNMTAKGEFSGSVLRLHPARGFLGRPGEVAGTSRSSAAAAAAEGSADWSRSSGAGSGARAHQSALRLSKRELWESRAALAADMRGMRATARLMRAENRRLAGEAAALQDSVEGLMEGFLTPNFVKVHAESLEHRLDFIRQFGPVLSARGSARAPRTTYHPEEAYETEAEAVAAAAVEAADAAAGEVYDNAAVSTTAARPLHTPSERPVSAPSTSYPAAVAAAAAAVGRMGDVYSVGGSADYAPRARGVHDNSMYDSTTRSKSKFRYIPPAELRLQRDIWTEVQLRQRLSNALAGSREVGESAGLLPNLPAGDCAGDGLQALDLLVPPGADADEVLQLVEAVRQQRHKHQKSPPPSPQQRHQQQQPEESAQQVTASKPQEALGSSGSSSGGGRGSSADLHPPPPPLQRRVSFAAGTRGGEDTVSSAGIVSGPVVSATLAASSPPSSWARSGSAAAAALAAAQAAADPPRPLSAVRSIQREDGEGERGGGEGDDGGGASEETAAAEGLADGPQQRRRHLTEAMVRVLNARAAGELMYPRPPPPDPFGDRGKEEVEAPPATPSMVRAFAILAAMGGSKMDVKELHDDPRVTAVDQMLEPPASSLLALLYMSCRQSVPHPEEFLMGTDLEYAMDTGGGGDAAKGDIGRGGGGGEDGGGAVASMPSVAPPAEVTPKPFTSPLSGRPPTGDLFMDFDSPRRAPYGQTYRHVQAWSVRDAGLVLERKAREMELAGRYRMPRSYDDADKALQQRLNLDDPDLEDRADELRDQMQQEEYEERLRQAREEL